MRYLIDTNVLSELAKDKPAEQVVAWFSAHMRDDLRISSITLGEIAYGIAKMDDDRNKTDCQDWFESMLLEWFAGSVVAIDEEVMLMWARMRVGLRTLPVLDSLIAASALASGCALITRNISDFEGIPGLELVNPWNK